MKLVSVIVTSYNIEAYIKKAILSVINQSYKNIELIVVDDYSTDETINIINKLNKKYQFKVILKDINKGVSNSRNLGLDQATGDYIMFVDGDDFLKTNMITDMVEASDKYRADLIDSRQIFTVFNSKDDVKYFTVDKYYNHDFVTEDYQKIIEHVRYVHGKLFKKEIIGKNRFNENLNCYEDTLFNFFITKSVKKYVLLNKQYYYYLQRNNSLINTYNLNHLNFITVYNEMYHDNKIIKKTLYNDLLGILLVKVPRMNVDNTKKLEVFEKFLKIDRDHHWLTKLFLNNKWLQKTWINLFKNIDFVKIHFKTKMIFKKVTNND